MGLEFDERLRGECSAQEALVLLVIVGSTERVTDLCEESCACDILFICTQRRLLRMQQPIQFAPHRACLLVDFRSQHHMQQAVDLRELIAFGRTEAVAEAFKRNGNASVSP